MSNLLTTELRPNPWIHPITGVRHSLNMGEGGNAWTPPPDSIPAYPYNGRWHSRIMHVPKDDQERQQFLADMESLARGMSEMTGTDVRWFYIRDASWNVWGDFGYFIVDKNPKP